MRSIFRDRDDPRGEDREARRVMKRVKNGVQSFEELSPHQIGLLVLYYPWILAFVWGDV